MHRFIFVALFAVALAGCDRFPDNGLQISGMLPWENDCSIDPASELRRSSGLWDVSPSAAGGFTIKGQYVVTPLLESFIIGIDNEISAQPNNLQVTALDITLESPDGTVLDLGDGLPNPYRVTATTILPAAEPDSSSLGTTASVAIPGSYQDAVTAAVVAAGFDQVIVVMNAVGTTSGGFTQTSGPFFWPVTLCDGCLNLCPTPASGATLTEEQLEELRNSCAPGQDTFFYCSFPLPTECTTGVCVDLIDRQVLCSQGFYTCLASGASQSACQNQAIQSCL